MYAIATASFNDAAYGIIIHLRIGCLGEANYENAAAAFRVAATAAAKAISARASGVSAAAKATAAAARHGVYFPSVIRLIAKRTGPTTGIPDINACNPANDTRAAGASVFARYIAAF